MRALIAQPADLQLYQLKALIEGMLADQRSYEMGAQFGEWERRQTVGAFPRGGHGVFETKVRWPRY